jgi:hypothetical protein
MELKFKNVRFVRTDRETGEYLTVRALDAEELDRLSEVIADLLFTKEAGMAMVGDFTAWCAGDDADGIDYDTEVA